jgi:uncharacterized membrane protein YeaQ/YmgE (transglycosylase-associated protein family)
MGLLMNIVLGSSARDRQRHSQYFWDRAGGWIGYLILGFIGACLLIWIVRMVRSRAA